MEYKFSDKDITSFYKDLIELGDRFTVEDAPNYYVCTKDNSTRVPAFGETDAKYIALYGTEARDAVILNPLAEGSSETASKSWLVSVCTTTLAVNIVKIMQTILETGAECNKKPTKASASKKVTKKEEEEEHTDLRILKYLSKDAENF